MKIDIPGIYLDSDKFLYILGIWLAYIWYMSVIYLEVGAVKVDMAPVLLIH
jgi:hypothetical protein